MDLQVVKKDTKTYNKKRKIYISYHPEDFEKAGNLAKQILEIYDEAIYYDKDVESLVNSDLSDEKKTNISQMNLVVYVVTKKFLDAVERDLLAEYSYISKKQITILPILYENGLEDLFNKTCGERHLISALDDNFIMKLIKYFEDIFDVYHRIYKFEDPFYAKIFVSYRKKDKVAVRKLIDTIHSFRDFLNIEIWFDDFLIPGEDYNDDIESNIKGCDFVLLCLTKNMLDIPNYVEKIEYPKALEFNKKVIPIAMEDIDGIFLKKVFKGIENAIGISDLASIEKAVNDALKDLNIEKKPLTKELKRELGVFYKDGLRVELNFKLGYDLLTESALEGDIGAMSRMSKIYLEGIHFPINFEKYEFWADKCWRKSVEIYKNEIENPNRELIGIGAATEMFTLMQVFYSQGNLEKIDEIVLEYMNMVKEVQEHVKSDKINMYAGYMFRGIVSFYKGEIVDAITYLTESSEGLEKLAGMKNYHANKCLAMAYDYLSLSLNKLWENERNINYLLNSLSYRDKAIISYNWVCKNFKTLDDYNDFLLAIVERFRTTSLILNSNIDIQFNLKQNYQTYTFLKEYSKNYSNLVEFHKINPNLSEFAIYQLAVIAFQFASNTTGEQARNWILEAKEYVDILITFDPHRDLYCNLFQDIYKVLEALM